MRKQFKVCLLGFLSVIILTGCGPSKEKIAQAQSTYREMIKVHNQVVEAHSAINDNSLDQELLALEANIDELKSYNLNELSNDEIDILIDTMESLKDSYNGYLNTLGEIKISEDATRLTTINFSLLNGTDRTITYLALKEKGDNDPVTNVLEDMPGFQPGQTLIGLAIHKDVNNTPWLMELSDSSLDETNIEEVEENTELEESETPASPAPLMHSIELDVASFNVTNARILFSILYDSELETFFIE